MKQLHQICWYAIHSKPLLLKWTDLSPNMCENFLRTDMYKYLSNILNICENVLRTDMYKYLSNILKRQKRQQQKIIWGALDGWISCRSFSVKICREILYFIFFISYSTDHLQKLLCEDLQRKSRRRRKCTFHFFHQLCVWFALQLYCRPLLVSFDRSSLRFYAHHYWWCK